MDFSRRRFLKAAGAAAAGLGWGVPAAAAGAKPNIVFIMADDIGFECFGAYGSTHYQTPRLDELARTGCRFDQAYSQPVCTPSRIKLMTGKYNFRNYGRFGEMDLSEPTFAKMLKGAGYRTGIAGKWQLSPGDFDGPYTAGFDEYCLWHFQLLEGESDEVGVENKGSRYKSPVLFENGTLVPDTEGTYGPDIVSDFACDFMERHRDEPFCLYYPMMLTHDPFDPTPDSADWGDDTAKNKPKYFADMVAYTDKIVGKIVDKLDALGIRENTLLVFTGDNGTKDRIVSPLPGRGEVRGGKSMMTDAGTRVPFIANWPGTIPAAVSDTPIDFADPMPTMAAVAGLPIPEHCDGQNLLPLLKGEPADLRGWIFMSYSRNGVAVSPFQCFVRDARWKLYSDGRLYDVPNDWLEESPATGPEADAARARLQPILDRILDGATDVVRASA